jgi:hypothetical protein
MPSLGTPVACKYLGCNGLCIAISSLSFVEFLQYIHTQNPLPVDGVVIANREGGEDHRGQLGQNDSEIGDMGYVM